MSLVLRGLVFILLILLLHSDGLITFSYWPSWRDFKLYYINEDGRVVDSSTPNKVTTSEGQSYAMFFALVANDRPMFDKLLRWTENNLASGDLSAQLPAWLWGKNPQQQWVVLDHNSASDADLWIAYDLLEAGRLWKNQHYETLGTQLLDRILKEEVVDIPNMGSMLLPGKTGFIHGDNWRLNPSYLPPQILAKFTLLNTHWNEIEQNSLRLLIESSPKGFAPDWIIWHKETGWQPDQEHPNLGSYNAIRVYLWIGMLAQDLGYKEELVKHFQPMITLTQQLGAPPEKINTVTGKYTGKGPVGFSAALLPLMANAPELKKQRQRLDDSSISTEGYYNSVLRLFGQGWDQQHYRFSRQGELLPEWQ
ncbi:cellulose synthase complex periplasmic endoglucanase BcsZ [Legionella maioricensis]|uniref:cellulase n=1 Tax=Legionella maioricensis TaxID=2896528 RepID=A0A9X2D4R5_9GAMM|nr:cellulose synthase complex periplasmic endoglucanase BcsZ [Legionella maioricensis]MCL9685452.1 cellulase [Legionella maioricensis]MCL9689192.1 cellulase [Legionella maioricensis]